MVVTVELLRLADPGGPDVGQVGGGGRAAATVLTGEREVVLATPVAVSHHGRGQAAGRGRSGDRSACLLEDL
jgi:hypothetical protein